MKKENNVNIQSASVKNNFTTYKNIKKDFMPGGTNVIFN